ncbi:sensor domain-containing protein [Streptomyces sp. NPDC058221]|uniref:sensor histidine kinase n=1 Tax=Streptomyces sp. NPDC058221 TaxID=3346388 RepID=UPI0036ED9454
MTVTEAGPPPRRAPDTGRTRGRVARVLDAFGVPASRTARRALAHAVLGLVPGLLGLLLVPLLAYGALLSITRLGPPLLSLFLMANRGLTAVHRALLRTLLGEDVPAAPPGTRRPVADPNAWRAAAFSVAAGPVAAVAFVVQLPLRLYALAAIGYPLWFRSVHADGHRGLGLPGSIPLDTLSRALAVAGAGVLLLALAGLAGRQLARLFVLMGRALLGPGRLTGRIRDLEETRAVAVRDSAATLRRIERDLHDGAQARLVAVAMSLTRARDALAPERTDPAKARELVEHSLSNARTAMAELRDLVRGFHPPALDDGLDTALASLGSDIESATTCVRVRTDLPDRMPDAVETIAYFCVAELLSNATRHASPATVDVTAELDAGVLLLTVRDDGIGGARIRPGGSGGSGLHGLAERVRTIDGTMSLDSPAGGPTTAVIRLPVPEEPEGTACAS